jgi:hypothetical protein
MTFGFGERNSWGLPTAVEEESFKMMDRYFECGGNFIDTGGRKSDYNRGFTCEAAWWCFDGPQRTSTDLVIPSALLGNG